MGYVISSWMEVSVKMKMKEENNRKKKRGRKGFILINCIRVWGQRIKKV